MLRADGFAGRCRAFECSIEDFCTARRRCLLEPVLPRPRHEEAGQSVVPFAEIDEMSELLVDESITRVNGRFSEPSPLRGPLSRGAEAAKGPRNR